MARHSGRPLAPRHLRRPPAAPCVAHHAHSHVRLASRFRIRPTRIRRARAPAHHLHFPALCTEHALSTSHALTARRRTRATSSIRSPFIPPQSIWPRRPPRTRPPLPPTSTPNLPCHMRCPPGTADPRLTHTRRVAREQHTILARITTQHCTPGHSTTFSPRPNLRLRTRTTSARQRLTRPTDQPLVA